MATGTWYWYNAGFAKVLNKEVDLVANANLKLQLHTSTYTPNRNTHDYQDDLTNEVANGNGYTAKRRRFGTDHDESPVKVKCRHQRRHYAIPKQSRQAPRLQLF